MIKQIHEKEYRSLDLDSYSSVKIFLDDRKRYFRKFILKEKINENASQESDDMRFGSIVDCLLLTPAEFDERYTISTANKPNGQMEDFTNYMVKLTLLAVNDFGDLTRTLEEMMQESYELMIRDSKTGKLRDSLEKFQERFIAEGLAYYMEVRERGTKLVITAQELDQANNVVEYLINHPYTRELLNMVTSTRYEVINQVMVTGEIEGLSMKMMADRIVIDHDKKVITPFDLKVMGNVDIFPYNFLKLRYYIQLAVYTTLLKEEYKDYTVKPLRFLTVDKYLYMAPIVVATSDLDYSNAMNGFDLSGHTYKGLIEAIEDIKYHKANGIWTSSREAQENKGIVSLKLFENGIWSN